uniref:Pyrroline-5-carboxylate reductase n=1 Tax=Anopheles dirus TaxID=7168 RepID=A0A182NG99_9DIPT
MADAVCGEKVGFIGGGNMAFAIASGLLKKGVLQAEQIYVSATNLDNLQKRWSPLGVTHTTVNNEEVLLNAKIVFICVKPQVLPKITGQLRVAMEKDYENTQSTLFVSILAGVTLERLEKDLNLKSHSIVRAMPNTPMQVGVGCTVFSRVDTSSLTDSRYNDVKLMFGALGLAYEVPEGQINAVTGLAGCGPAYVYQFIEALADGGVKQGVPRAMALQLAAQTVMGAAKTVLDTGKHPGVLKDEVCSQGGATIHGVHALEQGSMRGTVMNAVERATKRAEELS